MFIVVVVGFGVVVFWWGGVGGDGAHEVLQAGAVEEHRLQPAARDVARRAGCGVLLDINNIYVNARNHGLDAHQYVERMPVDLVGEFHLAGHSVNVHDGREILIDTHLGPPCAAVLALYVEAVTSFPGVPTLFEWDTEVPALEVLVAEAHRIDRVRESRDADAR